MENLIFLDFLDEKIDGKSKSRPRLTRGLETTWDPFFGHLGGFLCFMFVSVICVPMFRVLSEKATQLCQISWIHIDGLRFAHGLW